MCSLTRKVDEGHRLKNPACRLRQVLSGFTARCRVLLTGTPIQNRIEELCSLVQADASAWFHAFQLEFVSPKSFEGLTCVADQLTMDDDLTALKLVFRSAPA